MIEYALLDTLIPEAVSAARRFYQEEERRRFVLQLPNEEAILPTARATIAALCATHEPTLLVSDRDTPLEGSEGGSVVVVTHTGLLSQGRLFTHLVVCDARGAYTPLYRQFAEQHLHPFGLAVGFTCHYHREEARGLSSFFGDKLCYFSLDDTTFIDEEMRRGMKFYKMACKDRLDDKVRMHPAAAVSVSAKQVFAQPAFEQTPVWDEIA